MQPATMPQIIEYSSSGEENTQAAVGVISTLYQVMVPATTHGATAILGTLFLRKYIQDAKYIQYICLKKSFCNCQCQLV